MDSVRLAGVRSYRSGISVVILGIDRLLRERAAELRGARVGLLCHAASVGGDLRHVTLGLREAGVSVVRCFGPEHGIWGDAQDMIAVGDDTTEPVTGAPVRSLYGATEESLSPRPEDLADLDVLLIDLQDVGARYYTYIYTAALAVRACARAGVRVWIADRPNPLSGAQLEGGLTGADWLSFVGLWPLPVRHGLTIGEVASLLDAREGWGADLTVIELEGWTRGQYHDETGAPWVQPSPNMPTLDTAIVYPGMCLIEGTNLSEGRGTTRPFELIGADFIEPFRLASALAERCGPGGPLAGVRFRPVYFRPTFHKYAGQAIGGVALHVTDRRVFEPYRTALHLLDSVRRLFGSALAWRTEVYEFVDDRLAIDLLCGGPAPREAIDAGADIDAVWRAGVPETEAFAAARRPHLRY